MSSLERSSENCDKINLNEYFHIQAHGAMLIFDAKDLVVLSVSENIDQMFQTSPKDILNKPIQELFDSVTIQYIQKVKKNNIINPISQVTTIRNNQALRKWVISAHISGKYIIVELEPFILEESDHDKIFNLSVLADELYNVDKYDQLYDYLLEEVYSLTEYDSIMVYQYQDQGYGKVLKHLNNRNSIDYTDHCFPASDTPKPVENLILRVVVRFIPDSGYIPSNLIGDLSYSDVNISAANLKGVVPIHLAFLENMGAKAAISIPLIVDNKLWGLIACQNSSPKFISVRKRSILKVVSSLVSLSLLKIKKDTDQKLQKEIIKSYKEFSSLEGQPEQNTKYSPIDWFERLTDHINYDGITYCVDNTCVQKGKCLSISLGRQIYDAYVHNGKQNLIFLEAEDIGKFISKDNRDSMIKSLVILVMSRNQNIYIILFRIGALEKLKWAGNPAAAKLIDGKLGPRASFKTWEEEHEDAFRIWTESEKTALEQIQILLSEKINQQRLEEQAYYDQLTGLYNRHYLEDAYNRHCKISIRRNTPLSVCIIDIDYFKQVNDEYGHDVGDEILIEVSKILNTSYRAEDIVARYGGEEFVVIMLGASEKVAHRRCEGVRRKIEKNRFNINEKETIDITLSIGVTTFMPKLDPLSIEDAVKQADDELYEAKENGRNQVRPKLETSGC